MNHLSGIIADLENQRNAIDRALLAVREIGGTAGVTTPKRRGRPPKQPDAATNVTATDGRERQRAAMRRYWATKRAGGSNVATKKRGQAAAGRRRLSEAMKARWASMNPPKKRAVA